jgi:hypothetical protein
MRVWLASYPRSGNTFARMILNEAFAVKSTSVYELENSAIQEVPWLRERVGYAGDLKSIDLASRQWVAVKTHGYPTDNEPAIYVVRDGRAAICSYAHWIQYNSDIEPTIEELIEGKVWPGSWTDHFNAWNPEHRPNTLLIRYEDLQSRQANVLRRISTFLNVPQRGPVTQQFNELHDLEPTLFRNASNKLNAEEMLPWEDLFYGVHGDLMKHLRYGCTGLSGWTARTVGKLYATTERMRIRLLRPLRGG